MPKNYTVTLPHYSVGPSCYDELGQVTRFYGRTAAVVGGETALAKAGPALKAGFEKAGVKLTEWTVYGKDSTNANVEKIVNNPKVQEADLLFGVGGGRAIDTVKTAADILGKPFFSVPTVSSNCAPVSAIAVIYKDDGALDHYHFRSVVLSTASLIRRSFSTALKSYSGQVSVMRFLSRQKVSLLPAVQN